MGCLQTNSVMPVKAKNHGKIDQYTIGDLLGSGGQADVYSAVNEQGERRAIKVFDHSNPRLDASIIHSYLDKER